MSFDNTNKHESKPNAHEFQQGFVKIRVPIRENSCRNNNSFEVLIKRISPTLKRITYKLNGHFSFFNDEDLFQEALVHLWQDYNDGKLEDKTDSYILQGCYFHLKNYLRKVHVKIPTFSLQALINEEGESLEDRLCLEDEQAADYLERLDNKLLVETIHNNGLTSREKDILYLCADGLTTREIGRKLGISHVRVVKLKANIKRKSNYLLDSNKRLLK